MFVGRAEEAMNFYISIFPDAKITEIKRYGKGGAGPENTIERARFTLGEQSFFCIDSPIEHVFSFTPSISFFVTCETVETIDRVFAALKEGGSELMPLTEYPFSKRFGWVADKFGVSWQVSLESLAK